MPNDHNVEPSEELQRLRRIETRLTRLCIGLGVEVMAGDQRVALLSNHPPLVELVGLDITLADILAFCRKERIVTRVVTLMHRGQVVGSVAMPPVLTPAPQPEGRAA